MSGGHFDYTQDHIRDIAEEVERIVAHKAYSLGPETLAEFEKAVRVLREAYVYAHRIDWLLSGDDGEEAFHERLAHDLKELK